MARAVKILDALSCKLLARCIACAGDACAELASLYPADWQSYSLPKNIRNVETMTKHIKKNPSHSLLNGKIDDVTMLAGKIELTMGPLFDVSATVQGLRAAAEQASFYVWTVAVLNLVVFKAARGSFTKDTIETMAHDTIASLIELGRWNPQPEGHATPEMPTPIPQCLRVELVELIQDKKNPVVLEVMTNPT